MTTTEHAQAPSKTARTAARKHGDKSSSKSSSTKKSPTALKRLDLQGLLNLSEHADNMLRKQRELLLQPYDMKDAPTFTGRQLADLCGIDPSKIRYLAQRDDLPAGSHGGNGQRRLFTLAEARQWVRHCSGIPHRPENQDAAVIAVVNFKGGSTKTTTAFNLAQGLSLRGRNVLLIDLDPQGSATTLTGRHPSLEVLEEQTIASIIYGAGNPDTPDDLPMRLPQATYWDGLDVIPSSPAVFGAELYLPQLINSGTSFEWWNVLTNALADLKKVYDVIIFDTAPALSYLTINAALASDGLIMPVPPEHLDYASSISFWSLLREVLVPLEQDPNIQYKKEFAFLDILVSKVDSNSIPNGMTKNWISMTYGDHVCPVEIPKSVASSTAANSFSTIHDIGATGSHAQKRLLSAYNQFTNYIDGQICQQVWGL